MRIRIRLKSGKRVWASAIPTSCPQLFITRARERDIGPDLKPSKRSRFSDSEWAITHRPSGYAVAHRSELREILALAELLAKSGIPWRELRSRKDSLKYERKYMAAVRLADKKNL